MKKYIKFENGTIKSRYDSIIHEGDIPKDAIEVSDELFWQTINENDGVWSLVDGEIVKLPLPAKTPEQIAEENKANRLEAYRSESDPLFFKYQRGEIDKQEWLDKVLEIQARYA